MSVNGPIDDLACRFLLYSQIYLSLTDVVSGFFAF